MDRRLEGASKLIGWEDTRVELILFSSKIIIYFMMKRNYNKILRLNKKVQFSWNTKIAKMDNYVGTMMIKTKILA